MTFKEFKQKFDLLLQELQPKDEDQQNEDFDYQYLFNFCFPAVLYWLKQEYSFKDQAGMLFPFNEFDKKYIKESFSNSLLKYYDVFKCLYHGASDVLDVEHFRSVCFYNENGVINNNKWDIDGEKWYGCKTLYFSTPSSIVYTGVFMLQIKTENDIDYNVRLTHYNIELSDDADDEPLDGDTKYIVTLIDGVVLLDAKLYPTNVDFDYSNLSVDELQYSVFNVLNGNPRDLKLYAVIEDLKSVYLELREE